MQTQSSPKPLPFFFVGKDVTTERITNYVNQKNNLLSEALGKPDTRSIWYSKEHIIKLLEEIDHAGGDGIRVSFGMYESTHEFSGQTCLVMNATREKRIGENVIHTNIVLENEPDYMDRSALPREIIAFPGENSNLSGKKDFNYGSPCPPRCNP